VNRSDEICDVVQISSGAQRTTPPILARWALSSFLLTFVFARCLVFLILTHRLPDLYLFVGQTHVHHLNYGIFLLAAVGAVLLFWPPRGRALLVVAVLYGVGLALTFDEFGMWLHLQDVYWQRASYDAVAVIAALLGLITVAPRIRQFQPRHWIVLALVIILIVGFVVLLSDTIRRKANRTGDSHTQSEQRSSTEQA
jgi:hypothetical protein